MGCLLLEPVSLSGEILYERGKAPDDRFFVWGDKVDVMCSICDDSGECVEVMLLGEI